MGMLAFSRESNLSDMCNINIFGKERKKKNNKNNQTLNLSIHCIEKKTPKYINNNLSSANNIRF